MFKKITCVLASVLLFILQAGATNVVILARASFLNRSGNLATTTIYTPPTNQNVRVDIYISEINAVTGVTPFISWTDETQFRFTNYAGQQNWFSVSLPIRAVAGTPISISVATDPTQRYDVWVTVEML